MEASSHRDNGWSSVQHAAMHSSTRALATRRHAIEMRFADCASGSMPWAMRRCCVKFC
jgi:hypothetical protein